MVIRGHHTNLYCPEAQICLRARYTVWRIVQRRYNVIAHELIKFTKILATFDGESLMPDLNFNALGGVVREWW